MPSRDRPRLVASSSSTVKLFVDDLREVGALSRTENRHRSEIIRELVHEALRLRRLRTIGRDEGENYIRRIHQEAIEQGVNPAISAIADVHLLVDKILTTITSERQGFDNHELLKTNRAMAALMAQLLQREIVTQNLVKVLMSVGMQKDDVPPEQIKRRISDHDEICLQQAQELVKRFFGDEGLKVIFDREKSKYGNSVS